MSAIAGILNLDGRPVESALLEVMIDSMAHRGAEGRGIWAAGSIGLCHRAHWTTPEARLESLPMELGGRVVLTGDVRLDNRVELFGLLGGHDLPSNLAPDGALVLAAYEKWGEGCIEHLLGDFAFAIWDARERKLFCGRDHMGIKPFYYALMPGKRFVFATEIKGVLSVPGVSGALNKQRIADAFVNLINDPEATFYAQVSKLLPAHSLTVKDASITTRRYWSLDPDRELHLNSDQEYAERFRELFEQAVHCRMRSSHPVGSMLSGGMDSSSISCVARNWLKANGKPKLQTFSGVFDEVKECDERPYIQTVLDQGHCAPNFILADSLSPFSDAESIVWHSDEPLTGGNFYLPWHSYRRAQELGVRVVLDGYDGDTTVSHGLGRLAELADAGKWLDLAGELRSGSRSLNIQSWVECWWSWFTRCQPVAQFAKRKWSGAMRRLRSPAPAGVSRMDLLNQDLVQKLGLRKIPPSPVYKDERERHYRLLGRTVLTRSFESMAHGAGAFNVEVRLPFMDIRLIEFCLSLPSNQKLRNGHTRFVMHNAMEGVLPEKIQWRPDKSNLGPSFEKGLFKFERESLGKMIDKEAGQLEEYIDLERIKEFFERFRRGEATEGDVAVVWITAGLTIWLRSRHSAAEEFILQRKEVTKE